MCNFVSPFSSFVLKLLDGFSLSFGFKASLYLVFELGNFSAISRVLVVLVTIVEPHVGLLSILRRLANTTGISCLII
jgi:hypothetical protein